MMQSLAGRDIKIHLLKFITLIFGCMVFVYSYACVFYSYRATSIQQQVRLSFIQKEKQKGKEDIIIPDFYFPKLRTDNDKFDTYHNALGMGKHFGVQHVFLNLDVHFDYENHVDYSKCLTEDDIINEVFKRFCLGK